MIKNIVFDIGNVLVDFRWEAFLRDRGAIDEDVKAIAEASVLNPIWKDMDHGVRPEAEVIEEMKNSLPGREKLFMQMFENPQELVRPFPGTREWIEELRARGFKIYLLSNYPKELFAYHAEHSFNFMDLTDGRVVSAYVKTMKPDYEIYELLMNKYGLKAEESVFLDDRAENTKAAAELGFKTVTVKSREQAINDLETIISSCVD